MWVVAVINNSKLIRVAVDSKLDVYFKTIDIEAFHIIVIDHQGILYDVSLRINH